MEKSNVENKILSVKILPIIIELDEVLINTSYAMYEYLTQNTIKFEPYFDITKVLSKEEFDNRKYRSIFDWLVFEKRLRGNPKVISAILVSLFNTLNKVFYDSKNKLFDNILPNEFSNKIFNNKYIINETAFNNIVILIRNNEFEPEISCKINFVNKFYKSKNQNISYVVYKNNPDLYKDILKYYSNFGMFITDDIDLVAKLLINTKSKHEYLLPKKGYNKCPNLLKDMMIEYGSSISYY